MRHFDLDGIKLMDKYERVHLINSLTGFKSANLIGTRSKEGQSNLCIISSAFHLGSDPALLGFIIRPDVTPRHTLDNLRETQLCTMNHVHTEIIKNAHQTSAAYPKDTSEFVACGLTEDYREGFHAPFVREARLSVGLKMLREEKLPENGTHFIIAAVQHIWVQENSVGKDGYIDLERLQTVALSGVDGYHTTQKIARLPRAKVSE